MTFLWPAMLIGLVLIPLVILAYAYIQRRRQRLAASFARFEGNIDQKRRDPGMRRSIPAILGLISLVILLLAVARPQAEINLPRVEGTVMLVVDVSGSMAADDVQPTRLEAAKTAATEFVLSQPETVQIGIVSFSSSGFAVQTPTNDAQSLLDAIDRLAPQTGTSLGQGILVALHSIAVDAGLEVAPITAPDAATAQPGEETAPGQMADGGDLLARLPEGAYPPAVIVLLTDGENNMAFNPLEAAQAAAERSVRVDALGFGTSAGINLELDGFIVHTALDENALQMITRTAGGTYYNVQNETDVAEVYSNLTPEMVVKPETMELTSIFAGAGVLILLVGAGLSLLWFSRLV